MRFEILFFALASGGIGFLDPSRKDSTDQDTFEYDAPAISTISAISGLR
jgi:hypothetical protein